MVILTLIIVHVVAGFRVFLCLLESAYHCAVRHPARPAPETLSAVPCLQQRLLSLEHKEQENELMQRYIDKLCEEDAEHQLRHYSDQNQLRADLNQCNTDLMTHKEHVKERERVLDESVLVYQRAKAVRGAWRGGAGRGGAGRGGRGWAARGGPGRDGAGAR